MKLEKLAGSGVVVLNANDTVNAAIQQMWELEVRHLPVVHQGNLVGMVSERDVLFHVCWQERHAFALDGGPGPVTGATRIDKIMASPVVAMSPSDSVCQAARLMLREQISAVPLCRGGAAFGIVTETDFLKCYTHEEWLLPGPTCRRKAVADHMATHVFSVTPQDATQTALRLMQDKQLHHVPVVESGQLVGIVTDRDILRGAPCDQGKPLCVDDLRTEPALTVEGVMSDYVEVIGLSATLEDAARLMVSFKMGAAPVVADGRLVGILTETDLLRIFIQTCD